MRHVTRTREVVLGMLFALAVIFGMLPGTALADDPVPNRAGDANSQSTKSAEVIASVTTDSTTTTYTALEGEGGALEAWVDGSTLTLLGDCTVTNTIVLDAGSRTLDLGGKTLTSSENTFSMRGGSLELKDSGGTGKIDATSGSVIYFSVKYSGSSVTMSGGTITASGSGGMGVSMSHGTFTMKGGTITGCSKGVDAGENTELHLSGSPKITGNKRYDNGSPNNVMILSGATVTIDGPLGDGAQIGVRSFPQPTGGNDVVIATNDGSFDMHDELEHFTSDDEGIFVKAADTALVLSTSDEDVHYHDGISYTAWTDALAKAQHGDDSFEASNCLPATQGNYYLTKDVSLNEQLVVPSGTTHLCLNGKKIQQAESVTGGLSITSGISLNLDDCLGGGGMALSGGKGVTVNEGGAFTMNGGEIAGNNSLGVTVNEGGTFTLNGGVIDGNKPGVTVNEGGAFTMNGGEITGNDPSSNGGVGGVHLEPGSTFSISGSPIIADNNGGNLRMPSGSTITVSGELDKSKASIGLTLCDEDDNPVKGVFTTGLAEKGLITTKEDARTIFRSDSDNFAVSLTSDGNEARLVNATPVPYQAWDGSAVVDVQDGCEDYELVSENTTELKGGTWYVVTEDIDIAGGKRIWVIGADEPAHLILCDGATLTASGGVDVSDAAALSIYGQSGNTGALVATVPAPGPEDDPSAADSSAGIGGGMEITDSGAVTIHGGKVTAKGGTGAAGIGGAKGGSGGAVTVYGGEVWACSMSSAKHAIGYGEGGTEDGTITLGKGVTLGGSENDKDWVDLTKSTTTRMAFMKSPCTVTPVKTPTSITKAKVTLAKTAYAYDGKAKKPKVKSVVLDGRTLREGTDYTVSYKDNVKVGTAIVTVTGAGDYIDSAKATFAIKLAKAKLSTIGHVTRHSVELSWKKVAGAKSYRLQYKQAGGKWKTLTVKGTSKTVSNLETGKLYQFRVRAMAGKQAGAWSKACGRYLSRVSALEATVGKPGSVTATWKADPKANAGYVVLVRYEKDGKVVARASVAKGKTKATVRGLKRGMSYLVQVRPMRTSDDVTYIGVLRGTRAKAK